MIRWALVCVVTEYIFRGLSLKLSDGLQPLNLNHLSLNHHNDNLDRFKFWSKGECSICYSTLFDINEAQGKHPYTKVLRFLLSLTLSGAGVTIFARCYATPRDMQLNYLSAKLPHSNHILAFLISSTYKIINRYLAFQYRVAFRPINDQDNSSKPK
jgi:hypothetical protein